MPAQVTTPVTPRRRLSSGEQLRLRDVETELSALHEERLELNLAARRLKLDNSTLHARYVYGLEEAQEEGAGALTPEQEAQKQDNHKRRQEFQARSDRMRDRLASFYRQVYYVLADLKSELGRAGARQPGEPAPYAQACLTTHNLDAPIVFRPCEEHITFLQELLDEVEQIRKELKAF